MWMLTTVDNPWSPVTHYDEWFAWDANAGYHTPAFLARVTNTSSELSPGDQAQAVDWAIEEIVRENVNGLYRKVSTEEAKV